MPTITTTVDTDYARVGVTLSGFPADGPVDVYRVHPDDTRHLVRGVSDISGGAAFGWDYEAPLSAPVHYEADDGSTVIASGETAIPERRAWLRSPGLPFLDMPVDIAAVPSTERSRPTVVLRPFGRRSAIVLSDTAKSPEFTIRFRTYTYDDADSLVALFEQTPTGLLLMPGAREAHRYVSLGSLVEVPVTGYIARDGQDEDDPGAMSEWEVECVVTDSPVGGIFGDPTASYQAVLDATPTYAALLAGNPSYLDVLKGV